MPENQGQTVQETEESEIDLLELLYYFQSRLGFIIAGLLLGGIVAGLATYFFITPKYTAEAKLYMVSPSNGSVVDISDLNIGTSISADYEELVRTRPLVENVIKDLKLSYTFEEVLGMMSVSTISNTRILTIEVTSESPKEAKAITNRLANEAVTRLPSLMDTPEPHIAESAIIPKKKSSPSFSKNIMLGSFGAAAVVLAFLTVLFVTDDTLKTAEDVEKFFGVMPLTVIPEGNIGVLSENLEKKKRKRKKERYEGHFEKKKKRRRKKRKRRRTWADKEDMFL